MQELRSDVNATPIAPGAVSLSQRIIYWLPTVSVKPVPLAAGHGGLYVVGVNVGEAEDVGTVVDDEIEIDWLLETVVCVVVEAVVVVVRELVR